MSAPVAIRPAIRGDLPRIQRLFVAGELPVTHPAQRTSLGGAPADALELAFDEIAADPNNHVYVAELEGTVVGTFQLTFIRQLTYGGCLVAQVESVFVDPSVRSQGVGRGMLEFARAEAERRGALRLQLTSNVRRERAHAFYERLGFQATHTGMKLYLSSSRRKDQRTTES
jgi:GNAT superfamily N-acetyltransferase